MLNLGNSIFGLLMLIAGIVIFARLINQRIKGDKGGYGNHIEIYTAAVTMIVGGLILLIKELMKL